MHSYYHLCNTLYNASWWVINALFNEVPHLTAILFLNWAHIMMPLLASVLGRRKTNVATVRTFKFLSTSQSSYHTCTTKGLRNIYYLRCPKISGNPSTTADRSRNSFRLSPVPTVVKTFITAGISHLWKQKNPTWATLALPNKECFRAGREWNSSPHESVNLI